MSIVYLPKGSLLSLNGVQLTEHNRQPLSVSVNRIENAKRMANGTMRKYFIADKRTWSTSWKELPEAISHQYAGNTIIDTVDGKAGMSEIEAIYNSQRGSIALIIGAATYYVMFKDFNKTLTKRGIYNGYDVDIVLEEV